uniref:Uncharacterized protein n=1 Tax=Phocoena sinus TaxID=42100 RepID=A0A8C9B089_PHOSS
RGHTSSYTYYNLMRPKITYRILFRQPHNTCCCSYPHPNSLKLHRSYLFNSRPLPHIIYIILPGELKLRASP